MNSRNFKIMFGIIWLIGCLAFFLTIREFNTDYNYVFYAVIGFFALIGIVIIVSSIKSSNKIDENYEPTDDEIRTELENSNPIANKIGNATVYALGIRYLIAGSIAGIVALFEILFFLLGLGDKKLSEMLFDLVGLLMFSCGSIIFIWAGVKKIKLGKKIKNISDNM